MAAMLGHAARRRNSRCWHGRHCEDWSHQHANWPATKRAQRQAEKREWQHVAFAQHPTKRGRMLP